MKVVDIANTIYENLGRPTDTSVAAIAFWVRSKIGNLNTLLCETFYIEDDTYEIIDENEDEISVDAVAVLETMYSMHQAQLDIRSNINSLSTDSIIEVNDQGSSVRKVNKNEVAKTIVTLRKDLTNELTDLVKGYKTKRAIPYQVVGDDTVEGNYPPLDNLSTRLESPV